MINMGNEKSVVSGVKGEWVVSATSSFYLGSGDQPGNLISYVVFSSENYVNWARETTLSLPARRKFGCVDGTIPKSDNLNGLLDWDTIHSMIVLWMLRNMDSKIAATIPLHDNAKDLWDYLERQFRVANGPRIQQIKAPIPTANKLRR